MTSCELLKINWADSSLDTAIQINVKAVYSFLKFMVGRVCGLPYNLIIFHDFFTIYLLSLREIKNIQAKKRVLQE